MQGLTAQDPKELQDVLAQLHASDLGDHLLHESFNPDDPTKFTRSNFGWACSLFAELVLNRVMGMTSPMPPGRNGGNGHATTASMFYSLRK